MKKLALTIAIVLGLSMASFADGGGLFQRGTSEKDTELVNREGGLIMPGLPNHGETGNQDAPLGSGVAIMLGLGAAYLVGKRRNEE